jgi:Mu transposase-like protein
VEACVLIVERWLIGRLRDRRFYSLAELNAAIGKLLRHLNEERPIRRLRVTRRQLLEELDRPALKPLPSEPYVFAEWRVRRVGIDYHVEVAGYFHSIPYRFARSEVEVRLTGRTVEIFVKGERIAVHMRSSGNGKHTTVATTCRPATAVTPTGPSAASPGMPPSSARPPRRCAISFSSSGLTPSRASDPVSDEEGFLRRPASEVQEKQESCGPAREGNPFTSGGRGHSHEAELLALAAKPACVSWVARARATSGVICATIATSPGPCPSTTEKSVITTDLSNTFACALFASGKMNGVGPRI